MCGSWHRQTNEGYPGPGLASHYTTREERGENGKVRARDNEEEGGTAEGGRRETGRGSLPLREKMSQYLQAWGAV